MSTSTESENEKLLEIIWDAYDVDNSGFLEEKEAKKLFRHMLKEKRLKRSELKKVISQMIKELDTNGDGKLDKDELRVLICGVDKINDFC